MSKIIDLENHISTISANQINAIIKPLVDSFGITYFRYLKIYKNGKRIMLSNLVEAISYIYEYGNFRNMWFDGDMPEFVKAGWHAWNINFLLDQREVNEDIQQDLISVLNVSHGLSYLQFGLDFYEVFSFDSPKSQVYGIDKENLIRFIFYFKEQAQHIIRAAEADYMHFPIHNIQKNSLHDNTIELFLDKIKTKRYYLGGKFNNAYLTEKELVCLYWLAQGKTSEEIAMIENIKMKTVQTHFENIKKKFNLQKQTQLVQLFLTIPSLEGSMNSKQSKTLIF